jgi:Outer membrane protein beta-barrel domain
MHNRPAMFLALAALIVAPPLRAQSSDNSGLSVAVGAGAAWVRVSCDVCQTTRDLGPSAFVRVGKMLRPGVRVAGEVTAWTHEVADERENLGAAMAVLYLHPNDGPLYVKAGVGYVGYRAGDDIAMNAAGMQVGAGYELRLGSVALNNYVNLIGSSFASLKNEATTFAGDVNTTMLQFGVGLTLR